VDPNPTPTLATVEPRTKFSHPDWTAKGERRASVPFERLDTLWINTGTLCNITCVNCYIESSPRNDRLAYFTARDAAKLYDEIERDRLGTREIGFTGGEPFMNPELLAMAADALARGYSVLILTNAMQPMLRPAIKRGLLDLNCRFGAQLQIRASLDHYTRERHEEERGQRSWRPTLAGIDWLAANGFNLAVAGRTRWHEAEAEAREGYRALFAARSWPVDASSRSQLVLLPEMDAAAVVPEITTACWGILKKEPRQMMCATSRMVVKRKGADAPTIVPCTLLPYDKAFEMGATLAEAARADGGMFDAGAVKLCHPHCAKFCVLGGGSCSGG
jgi:sulfatase maturation enzyme AslB (radical SAM superfamily)